MQFNHRFNYLALFTLIQSPVRMSGLGPVAPFYDSIVYNTVLVRCIYRIIYAFGIYCTFNPALLKTRNTGYNQL